MKRILTFLFAIVLCAALAVAGGYIWLKRVYAVSSGPLMQEQIIQIAPGTGGEAIASSLTEAGIIKYPFAFRILSAIEGKAQRFQAGEYAFAAGTTPIGVMEKLVKGEVIRYFITVPEGLTSAAIVALLQQNPVLIAEKDLPLPAEGSLLPETYDFTRGISQAALLGRMRLAQENLIRSLWVVRQQDLPFTTPQEAITLASIVEKETAVPEERKRVAAVYINRLKAGMLLQADPTVAYGKYGGQSASQPLLIHDLKTDTPYNTYMHKGLPPGPICHPGKASIEAVLHPLATTELYFVATGDGRHRFAASHEEHLNNVAAYRKWQKAVQKNKEPAKVK